MAWVLRILWAAGWLGCLPSLGFGQVFDVPAPLTWTPLSGPDETDIQAGACASAGLDLVLARPDGALVRYAGPGFTSQMLTLTELQAAAPGVTRVTALTNGRMLDRVFVGLERWPDGGPLVSFAPWGSFTLDTVATAEELRAPLGWTYVNACGMAPGPDGVLWVAVTNSPSGNALLQVDLTAPAGARVTLALDEAGLLAALAVPTATVAWGCLLAADAEGRTFFRVAATVPTPTEPVFWTVIVRRDADGTLTELTARERAAVAVTDHPALQAYRALSPASRITTGLQFDTRSGLLVGFGEGLWVLSPDRPAVSALVAAPPDLAAWARAFGGDDLVTYGPQVGCLTFLGEGRFASIWHAAFYVTLDGGRLDVDGDGLMGNAEAAAGTDPQNRDSDGGGIPDGAEQLDGTAPLDPGDDRAVAAEPAARSFSYRYPGSAFRESIGNPAYLDLYGLVTQAGEIRVRSQDEPTLYTFTDFDRPGTATASPGLGGRMAAGPDGSLYAVRENGPQLNTVVRVTPDGSERELLTLEALRALAGPTAEPVSVAADGGGAVFVGCTGGRLLEVEAASGEAGVAYDATADREAAGMVTDGWCTPECSCTCRITAPAFEPVRNLLYFWVETRFDCPGDDPTGAVLVARQADGTLTRIASDRDLYQGTGVVTPIRTVLDTEPDGAGGLWVLTALTSGLAARSLTHLDAAFAAHPYPRLTAPGAPALPGVDPDVSDFFAGAEDLLGGASGRLLVLAGVDPRDAPGQLLGEIVSLDPELRGGDLVVVSSDPPVIGKVAPTGGGARIYEGAPLERPLAVAATAELVAVADAGLQAVVLFPVQNGRLRAFQVYADVGNPSGLDIDQDGTVVVADMAANRLVRIDPLTGTVDTLFASDLLAMPGDVVLLADGSIAVTANEAGQVLRFAPDGTPTLLAEYPSPWALAVVSGGSFAVAALDKGVPPARILGVGLTPRLLSDASGYNAASELRSGGLAAAPDGTVFWIAHAAEDPVVAPFAHADALFRVDAEGRAECLAATVLNDVARVRPASEPLPAVPVPATPPADAGQGDTAADAGGPDGTAPDAARTDLAALDADGGGGPSGGGGGGGGGGCAAAPDGAAGGAGLFVALLALLGLGRRGRGLGAFLAGLCLLPTPASAVWSLDRQFRWLPIAGGEIFGAPGALAGTVSCAAGPNLMMVVGHADGTVVAVGAGFAEGAPFETGVATAVALRAAAGVPLGELSHVAARPGGDRVYVAFAPPAGSGASALLAAAFYDGAVETVLTPAELQAAVPLEPAAIQALTVAPDGALWATVGPNGPVAESALLRIDPAAAPGARVTVVAHAQETLDHLADATRLAEWGRVLAVDDRDRAFFRVRADRSGAEPLSYHVLLRRNADGTYTELTARDPAAPATVYDSAEEWRHPVFGVDSGLAFDPESGLLYGHGFGVWLLDPERPGVAVRAMHSGELDAIARVLGLTAGGVPTCVAPLGKGWIGIQRYQLALMVGVDPDLLDLDRDRLRGFEEKRLGTDPAVADTDGGGLVDGAEYLDNSDPLDPADDRVLPAPPLLRSVSGRFWGSPFHRSFGGRFDDVFGLFPYGVAKRDGRLLVASAQPDAEYLHSFADWEKDAVDRRKLRVESRMVEAPDGSLYGIEGGAKAVPVELKEHERVVLLSAEEAAVLLGGAPSAQSLGLDGKGRLLIGYNDGQLLRLDPTTGTKQVVADVRERLIARGYLQEDGSCFFTCQCSVGFGPIVFDPVRALPYVWISFDYTCDPPPGVEFIAVSDPVLFALTPDDTLHAVASEREFLWALERFGGFHGILDCEPDGAGGLWVLAAHSIDRSLTHLDANFLAEEVQSLAAAPYPHDPPADTSFVSVSLAHAQDLLVTPAGRLFALTGTEFGSNTPYFLAELVPIGEQLRPGDLVVNEPAQFGMGNGSGLGKVLPTGGGIHLDTGGVLVQPTSVAATEDLVAVSDPGLGAVVRFPLLDGVLGPGAVQGDLDAPAGLDIDEAGDILVADRARGLVVRLHADGTQESEIADGLDEPADVLLTAEGLVVADAGLGQLLRFHPDGSRTVLAELPGINAVALVSGQYWVVGSEAAGTLPQRLDGSGARVPLVDPADPGATTAPAGRSGGLAAAPDGLVFWVDRTGPDPLRAPLRRGASLYRSDPAGTLEALVHFSGVEEDIARVRPRGEPLPAAPVAASPPGGDTTGGSDAGAAPVGCTEATGCAAGGAPGATAGAMVLLCAGLWLGRRRYRALALGAGVALCALTACEPPSDCAPLAPDLATDAPATPDAVPDAASDADAAAPDPCVGKERCDLAAGAVCDGNARRRCQVDAAGCPVWSPLVACPAGETCAGGVCSRDDCVPGCGAAVCGSDPCGNPCGTCPGGTSCCRGQCRAVCASDCTGRDCGSDGLGGQCGLCPDGAVCAAYRCAPLGQGDCMSIYACTGACDVYDTDCEWGCRESATPEASAAYSDVQACLVLHCLPHCPAPDAPDFAACLDDCLLGPCRGAYAQCAAGGTGTCAALHACLGACADSACSDACYAATSAVAALAYADLWACAAGTCDPAFPALEVDACLRGVGPSGACGEPFRACFGDCEPSCAGLGCGPDACGLLCGSCPAGVPCVAGQCE